MAPDRSARSDDRGVPTAPRVPMPGDGRRPEIAREIRAEDPALDDSSSEAETVIAPISAHDRVGEWVSYRTDRRMREKAFAGLGRIPVRCANRSNEFLRSFPTPDPNSQHRTSTKATY